MKNDFEMRRQTAAEKLAYYEREIAKLDAARKQAEEDALRVPEKEAWELIDDRRFFAVGFDALFGFFAALPFINSFFEALYPLASSSWEIGFVAGFLFLIAMFLITWLFELRSVPYVETLSQKELEEGQRKLKKTVNALTPRIHFIFPFRW